MQKLPVSGELIEWAEERGISLRGLGLDAVSRADETEREMQARHQVRGLYDEAELQRRCLEYLKNQRDKRIWWFTLLSMLASVASAMAALVTAVRH